LFGLGWVVLSSRLDVQLHLFFSRVADIGARALDAISGGVRVAHAGRVERVEDSPLLVQDRGLPEEHDLSPHAEEAEENGTQVGNENLCHRVEDDFRNMASHGRGAMILSTSAGDAVKPVVDPSLAGIKGQTREADFIVNLTHTNKSKGIRQEREGRGMKNGGGGKEVFVTQ